MGLDFYATAAQVIPVFFLAMIFESRVLLRGPSSYSGSADPDDPRLWNGTQIVAALFFISLMVVAEVVAISALYSEMPSEVGRRLTLVGLLAGLGGVALPVISHQCALLRRHVVAVGPRSAVGFLGFFLALMVVLLVVLVDR